MGVASGLSGSRETAMLATRPAPAAVGTLSAETGSSSQEEKSVPGVRIYL